MKKSAEPSVYAGTVSISLLGGFSLEMNGATLTDDINRSLKLWSVLAYLVLHRNRMVKKAPGTGVCEKLRTNVKSD